MNFLALACFSLLCGLLDSVNIECKYEIMGYTGAGSAYQCYLQNTLNITTKESAVINSASGVHLSSKGNKNVTGFCAYGNSRIINYFPRNLANVFGRIKAHYNSNLSVVFFCLQLQAHTTLSVLIVDSCGFQ